MGDSSDKGATGKKDKLRVDLLAEAAERYRIMAYVFYRRLDNKEKVDALLEVAELLKEETIETKKD